MLDRSDHDKRCNIKRLCVYRGVNTLATVGAGCNTKPALPHFIAFLASLFLFMAGLYITPGVDPTLFFIKELNCVFG